MFYNIFFNFSSFFCFQSHQSINSCWTGTKKRATLNPSTLFFLFPVKILFSQTQLLNNGPIPLDIFFDQVIEQATTLTH